MDSDFSTPPASARRQRRSAFAVHRSRRTTRMQVASTNAHLGQAEQLSSDADRPPLSVHIMFSGLHRLGPLAEQVVAWGDQLVGLLFARPRRTQGVAGLLGLLFLGWSLLSGRTVIPIASLVGDTATADRAPADRSDRVEQPAASDATPVHVIAAYNAASIAAGRTGDVTLLYPFLTPSGAARHAVDVEFGRRSQQLERHAPELVRWGLVTSEIGKQKATIQTQEVWHDATLLGGKMISADRNMIARHTYHLVQQDTAQPWLIDRIETTSVVR